MNYPAPSTTSFLPDREREEAERREREELRQEWLKRQEELKKEEIEITYSYWDGSGHRKSVSVRKVMPLSSSEAHDLPVVCSAKKVTLSALSLRNVDSSFLNCEVLVLII